MATASETLATALQHHQAGRLHSAEQCYRRILAAEPNHADAWHLLGIIAYQVGRHELAVEYIGRAIGSSGTVAAFHNNLGNALQGQGKLVEAVACYHRAVQLKPDYVEAHNNLGTALRVQGMLGEAAACYRRALELNPDYAEAHNNLGTALSDQGKPDDAVACYRRAVQLKPDFAEAHNNLGTALQGQGKLDGAVACYRRALELKPQYADAYNNLGTVLNDQGKLDEAAVCYRRALELKPDSAEAHNNLGNACKCQGKLDDAVACYRRALELKPDYAKARNNLGAALQGQGKLPEAVACHLRALELKPDDAEALNNLGAALKGQGKLDDGGRLLPPRTGAETRLCRDAQQPRRRLAGPGKTGRSGRLLPPRLGTETGLRRGTQQPGHCLPGPGKAGRDRRLLPPRTGAETGLRGDTQQPRLRAEFLPRLRCPGNPRRTPPLEPAARPAAGEVHRAPCQRPLGPIAACGSATSRPISATTWLDSTCCRCFGSTTIGGSRFFVTPRCFVPTRSPTASRAMPTAWRNAVGWTDEAACPAHSRGPHRHPRGLDPAHGPQSPAGLRPQARPRAGHVCRLSGTTGLAAIDYRLTDPYLDPPGFSDGRYAEESIRLPDTFWCYDPLVGEPAVNPLPALEKGCVTFGCLNNFCKINAFVLKLWAQVLKAVEHSQLMILAAEGAHRQRTLDLLSQEGIAPDRVIFIARQPRRRYLELYHRHGHRAGYRPLQRAYHQPGLLLDGRSRDNDRGGNGRWAGGPFPTQESRPERIDRRHAGAIRANRRGVGRRSASFDQATRDARASVCSGRP